MTGNDSPTATTVWIDWDTAPTGTAYNDDTLLRINTIPGIVVIKTYVRHYDTIPNRTEVQQKELELQQLKKEHRKECRNNWNHNHQRHLIIRHIFPKRRLWHRPRDRIR